MPQPVTPSNGKPNASVRLPRKPHRLVAAWIEEDRRNRASAREYGWALNESYEIKKRVFCAYDALFKAAERRGHTVTHERFALRPAWLVVNNERIDIMVRVRVLHQRVRLSEEELRDPTNVALNRRWKQSREPAGTLLLEATAAYRRLGKRRWEDTVAIALEDHMDVILPEIEYLAEEVVTLRLEDAERDRRWEHERQRKQRREAVIARADRRWDLARKAATDWEEAARLRCFVEAVAERMGHDQPRRAAAWLKWARARIDDFDPLAGSREELFEMLMARPSRHIDDDILF